MQFLTKLMIYNGYTVDFICELWHTYNKVSEIMPKNYLLIYSEQLATDIELLCKNTKAVSNTIFQIRKSSNTVGFIRFSDSDHFANIAFS